MLAGLCELLSSLASRLANGSRRLLERGLREAARRVDVAALYHYASFITRTEYFEEPELTWPGFFKKQSCKAMVKLPPPHREAGLDTLEAIRRRRSRREYASKPLSLVEISTLLYHAVGITGWDYDWPLRAYPSAGGLQPLEAYLVATRVEQLEKGLYHYDPHEHALCLMQEGDYARRLADICLGQGHVAAAPASIILTAVYARTASKYGARAYRYIFFDAGSAAENLYLAAESLGLATVVVGAFYDEELCSLLGIDCYNEIPIAVLPIGHRIGSTAANALGF